MVLVQHHRPGYSKGSEKFSSKRSNDLLAQKTLLALLGLLTLVLVHRHFVLKLAAFAPDEHRRTFRPGDLWLDNHGVPIQVRKHPLSSHRPNTYFKPSRQQCQLSALSRRRHMAVAFFFITAPTTGMGRIKVGVHTYQRPSHTLTALPG